MSDLPQPSPQYQPPVPTIEPRETFVPKKMAAGICGILLGGFGVHKFILGNTTAGVIMLCVSVFTCFIGSIPMHIIGIIEGIMYLSKPDEQFYQEYAVQKKQWF